MGKAKAIKLGLGKAAVSHGSYQGLPCLFLMAVKQPGEIGAKADIDVSAGPPSGAVVIQFATTASILGFMDLIRDMVAEMAAWKEAHDKPPSSNAQGAE